MRFSCCSCVVPLCRAGHACAHVACRRGTGPASIAPSRWANAAHAIWEEVMTASGRPWRFVALPIAFAGVLSVASAAELNPAAVTYKLPDQIAWGPVNAAGAQQAVVVGDPSKPGFYMVYNKWTKGNHFSRPHSHPNDRYIVVLQGTWWVGSGPTFDPANGTVPM